MSADVGLYDQVVELFPCDSCGANRGQRCRSSTTDQWAQRLAIPHLSRVIRWAVSATDGDLDQLVELARVAKLVREERQQARALLAQPFQEDVA